MTLESEVDIEHQFEQLFENYLLCNNYETALELADFLKRHKHLHPRYAEHMRMQVHLVCALNIDKGLARPSARYQRLHPPSRRSFRKPSRRRMKGSRVLLAAALLLGALLLVLRYSQSQSFPDHEQVTVVQTQQDDVSPAEVPLPSTDLSFTVLSGSTRLQLNGAPLLDAPQDSREPAHVLAPQGSRLFSGSLSTLEFDDGSHVALLAGTEIELHNPRSGSGIIVHDGTMVVSIDHGVALPAWRGTTIDGLAYTVTGTSFMVSHSPENQDSVIAVRSGSVDVSAAALDAPLQIHSGMALRKGPLHAVSVKRWELPIEPYASWSSLQLHTILDSGVSDAGLQALADHRGWQFNLSPGHPLRRDGVSILILHAGNTVNIPSGADQEILGIHSHGGSYLAINPALDDNGNFNRAGTNFIFSPQRGTLYHDLEPRNDSTDENLRSLWTGNDQLSIDVAATYGIPERLVIFPGVLRQTAMMISLAFDELDKQ